MNTPLNTNRAGRVTVQALNSNHPDSNTKIVQIPQEINTFNLILWAICLFSVAASVLPLIGGH